MVAVAGHTHSDSFSFVRAIRTPFRLFISPFIHAYTPPFFALIWAISRPYPLRFVHIRVVGCGVLASGVGGTAGATRRIRVGGSA